MTGGLFDPLGMEPVRRRRAPGGATLAAWLAGSLLAALAVLLAVAWLRDDGNRGRPSAVAPIEHVDAPPKAPAAVPAPAPPAILALPATPSLPPPRDDQDVEIQNGVRIIRPRRPAASPQGGLTVPVNPSGPAR